MSGDQGQLLFGTVAVRLGYTTAANVEEAIKIQEQLIRLGVKKPLGQVMRDEGWITEEQERAVLEYQRFRRERNQDKKLGELAVENGFCTEAQLKDALATQKEHFRINGKTYPLGKILQDRGILSEQQVRALVRVQQRAAERRAAGGHVGKTLVGVRECGNCYEVVPIKAGTCSNCGNHFGSITIAAQCKICKANQSTPGEYCAKCGAHLVTGAKPRQENLRQCNKCGKFGATYAAECLHCGHIWDATMIRERRKEEEQVKRTTGEVVRWVVALLVLGVGVWALFNYETIRDYVLGKAVGADTVAVRRRAEEFLKAVQFGDAKGATAMLAAPREFAVLHNDLFGLEADRYRVAEAKVADVKVDRSRATVYVEAVLGAVKKEDQRPPEEQIKAILAGTAGERRKITMEWVYKSGDWFLQK